MQNALADYSTRIAGGVPPPQPLTHHEILSLVGPFTRRGRHVDLGKTDRLQRRLVFKPTVHAAKAASSADITETLQLENPGSGRYRLTRSLTLSGGLEATLCTEGSDPDSLLSRMDAVPPEQQFRSESGIVIAISYRLQPTSASPHPMSPVWLAFTHATAHLDGLTVLLQEATVTGYPAEVELLPRTNDLIDLPEDLLAVLGWDWGLLRRRHPGWRGNLRVRGSKAERTRQLEVKMQRTVAHIAATLARTPSHFHETRLLARWGVTGRRAIPLLIFIGLIAGVGGLSLIEIAQDSALRLLLMGSPPLLLIGAFGMRERPPLEIPPPPLRSRAGTWPQPTPLNQA